MRVISTARRCQRRYLMAKCRGRRASLNAHVPRYSNSGSDRRVPPRPPESVMTEGSAPGGWCSALARHVCDVADEIEDELRWLYGISP